MNTKQAVIKVLKREDITPYRLAKNLGVQPIMITNYIDKGTRMGKATYEKFLFLYGIEVSDVYNNRKVIDGSMASSDKSE